MNKFISKQILTSQTIGEQLAKARKGASLSQKDVSAKIGIKERYIFAIEFGLYSELPGDIYTLEFVKKYAIFLRMDPVVAVRAYKKERGTQLNFNYKLGVKGESYKLLHRVRWATKVLMSISVIVFVVYVFVFLYNIFSPPSILITPKNEYVKISSSQITLQGKVSRAKEVFINTNSIALSQDGTFIESFNLPKGLNLLKITARSRFGKQTTVYRMIYVENSEHTLVFKNNK